MPNSFNSQYSAKELQSLANLADNKRAPQTCRQRALMLLALDQATVEQVARKFRISPATVYHWRRRFRDEGANVLMQQSKNAARALGTRQKAITMSPTEADNLKLLLSQLNDFLSDLGEIGETEEHLKTMQQRLYLVGKSLGIDKQSKDNTPSKIALDEAKNQQTVKLEDIAKEAGVSKMTVSRALRDLPGVSYENYTKIKKISKKLGYTPSPYVSFFQSYARSSKTVNHKGVIGWVDDWSTHNPHWWYYDWNRSLLKGAQARAEQLGFSLSKIDMNIAHKRMHADYKAGYNQIIRITRARGIHGIILPHLFYTSLSVSNWKDLSVVLIGDSKRNYERILKTKDNRFGSNPKDPVFYHAIQPNYVDNFTTAWEQLISLGYRRPGLALTSFHDYASGLNFRKQFVYFSSTLPESGRVAPLIMTDTEKMGAQQFKDWVIKQQPDVVICKHNKTRDWLRSVKLDVPRDIGLLHLGITADIKHWSGIRTCQEEQGKTAVDQLIALLKANERIPPIVPKHTQITGKWHPGETLVSQR